MTLDPFPIPAWWRGDASLSVTHGDRATTFGQSHELVELPGTPRARCRANSSTWATASPRTSRGRTSPATS
nr:hypothetical protein [Halogeometricum sp. CBA1124]